MKLKKFTLLNAAYESPTVAEVDVTSEGILCVSGTIEKFGFVEDEDGWDL